MEEFGRSPESDQSPVVRRIVLPSGKTIEVAQFDTAPDVEAGLHVCPTCACELVYPTDWDEAGQDSWQVSLRCPGCEWAGSGVFTQEVIERFDAVLDTGTEALLRDLRQLMRANMEDEVDVFVSALYAGHILPEDF